MFTRLRRRRAEANLTDGAPLPDPAAAGAAAETPATPEPGFPDRFAPAPQVAQPEPSTAPAAAPPTQAVAAEPAAAATGSAFEIEAAPPAPALTSPEAAEMAAAPESAPTHAPPSPIAAQTPVPEAAQTSIAAPLSAGEELPEASPAEAALHAAKAALQAGDAAGAEAALEAGMAFAPTDLDLGTEHARMAEQRGDWPVAAERWRRLALAVPDAPQPSYGRAAALQRLGCAAEAEAVLVDLVGRFPNHTMSLHDLARHAENRADWAAAERWWRDFHAAGNSIWWSHSSLAAVVMRQGRLAEAEAILQDALVRFPDQPDLFADQARLAEARGDWNEALRRWDDVIARFPASWTAYRGKIAALAHTSGQDSADNALLDYAALLPEDGDALHDRARLAERRQDWPAAEAAWRGFLRREDHKEWAYQGLVQALIQQDRLADAEAALAAALAHLPRQPRLVIEAARLSELRDQPEAAAAHWQEVGRLLPAASVGPVGEATLLARHGNIAGAEAVIAAALARLPDDLALHEVHADIATAAGDDRKALARLQTAQRRFPAEPHLAERIEAVETRLAEAAEDARLADPEAEAASDDIRTLLLDFESLGGSAGQGGMFAAFQQAHGAEPLGLLRWAEALPDGLSKALEADLADFGAAAQTDVAVPLGAPPAQYRITDRRFGITMPSFIAAADTPADAALRLIEQRLSVLRGKLLDDLRAARRIFVYTYGKGTLTGPKLDRLHAACRRHGDATLLYLRPADPQHLPGTVAWDRPGLMIGAVDDQTEAATSGGPSDPVLLTVCQRAHALWLGRRNVDASIAAAPTAATPVTAGP